MLFLSRIGSRAQARCFTTIATLCVLTAPCLARAEDQLIKLAPDNPDVVAAIEIAEIFGSPAFKTVASQFPDMAKKLDEPLGKDTKLTPRQIESIFVAANTAHQDFVVVFNLTAEFELNDVIDEAHRANSEKIGDYTLFTIDNDTAMCLVDESTIAVGPKKSLRSVLKRDDDAEISDELEAAWDNLEDGKHLYVVATLDTLVKQAAGAIPPGIPVTPELLGKLTTATLTAHVGKKQISLDVDLNCTDKLTADQFKALLDIVVQGSLQPSANTPDEAKQALTSVKSSVEDEVLTVSFNVGLDVILSQIKTQLGEFSAPPKP